jgi:predicted metal-binding membrane protein
MATSASSPGRRSSLALWAGLLIAAALAWVLLIEQHPGMPAAMAGPWLVFGEFLLLWVVMMAAMMLPSVAPVASMYLRVVRSRRNGPAAAHPAGHPGAHPAARTAAGTAALVGGYLLAWAGFGVLAYGLSRALGTLAPMGTGTGMGMAPSGRAVWSAAIILAVAGLYQFSPLKARCLRHCRSPLGFLLHFGNYSGRLRDVRAGAYHGSYCVGCCWSLMLILVAVGLMNWAWMVGLTAVVFVEKLWRSGQAFGYAVGAGLIVSALLLPWLPSLQSALLT